MIFTRWSKLLVAIATIVLPKVTAADNTFIDDPPDGYYTRSSLDVQPAMTRTTTGASVHDDAAMVMQVQLGCDRKLTKTQAPFVSELLRPDYQMKKKTSVYVLLAVVGWTDKTTGKVDYICGGSLIAARFIVTAAHCGQNEEKIPPDTVRLGDTDLASSEDDPYAQSIKIRKFIPHPTYKRTQKYYDIALIELEHDAKFDTAVCPICLWPHDGLQDFTGGLRVAGFGATDYASDISPTLMKATLDYLDYDTCNTMLPRQRSLFRGLSPDQFCAKTPKKDTCQGDSGGPIQIDLSDVNKVIPYLVGVTSFGTGCWDGSFGIYTKISNYVGWISSVVNVTVDPLECARQSECLSSRKFSDSRISPQNNSPFFRVELRRSGKTFNQCSGALIDYRHVVTSSSCTMWNGLEPTHIKANDQLINITEIVRHPSYVSGKHYHDIALLKLDKFYNPHKIYQIIAPACIWKNERIPDPIVFYSGNGPDFTGSSTGKLSNVSLKILTAFYQENGRCNTNYSARFKDELPGGFNNDFVCAENSVELIPAICQLEPGGPISNFRRDNVVPFVYGINTLGRECGGPGNVFVASRISSYYNWIEAVVLNKLDKLADNRFGTQGDLNLNDINGTWPVSTIVANRGDFPYEHDLVSYVLPGLIATDQRLKPYGHQLVPGGLKKLATASVHHPYAGDDDHPLKLTIYGAQLNHIPSRSEDVLEALNSIPIHRHQDPPVSNSVEIFKSVELGIPQPSREIIFHQQSNQYLPRNAATSPAPTLVHLWPKQSVSPTSYITPLTNTRYQAPTTHRLLVNTYLSGASLPFRPALPPVNQPFSVLKSIELYQDGRCTLSSGQAGRCVHHSICRSSAPFNHGWSYCNSHLLTVCCPI